MTLRRTIKEERGQSMIEFALVVPLLFVLLFGVFDFARAFNYWLDQTHLANEGARFAAVNRNPGGTSTSLQQYLIDQATTSELRDGSKSVETPLDICVEFPNGTSEVGDPVTVKATAEFRWLPVLGLDALTTQISGHSTMRLEAAPTNFTEDCP